MTKTRNSAMKPATPSSKPLNADLEEPLDPKEAKEQAVQ